VPSPPPPSQAVKSSKNYFPAEKIDLGNLLSTVSSKLNNEGLSAADRGTRFGSGQFASKEALQQRVKEVQDTIRLVETMRRGIWDEIILKNPKYATELNGIVRPVSGGQNPIVDYQNVLESYAREVDILSQKYDSMDQDTRYWLYSDLLGSFANSAYQGSGRFRTWIQECNNRIDGIREALR
jgi:hypothetical protein